MAYIATNFQAPALDGQALRRQLAPILMGNIVVGMQQKEGRGVTEKFSGDTNVSEIRVIRRLPLTFRTRTMGAATNGGYYNGNTYVIPQSADYGIKILHTIDQAMEVPMHMEDMINLDVAQGHLDGLQELLWKEMNASTMAEQILKSVKGSRLSKADGTLNTSAGHEVISYNKATDSAIDAFNDAATTLDNGDGDNGVDTFPISGRIVLTRASFKRALRGQLSGVYSIGNWKAQDMLKIGGISPQAVPNNEVDGYYGDIDSTPFMMVPSTTWNAVEDFLGAANGTLDEIEAMVTHSYGTLRAIASTSYIAMVPSQLGAGVRYLPKFRWGHETIMAKSVVLIGNTDKATLDAAITATEVIGPDSQ